MSQFTFRGLVAPAFTAFNKNFTLNLDVIPKYAKFLADSKIMGVLVNATTSEGMSLTVKERKQVTEEWAQAVKKTGQHLLVQVGGVPLPYVMELASHAESVNVGAILCLPEIYYKPTSSTQLIKYLENVAAAAPKTPLLYYHNPSYTHVHIHMGQFLTEIAGKIPNFHGIKFTSTDLQEGTSAVKANNGKFAVFLGTNQLMPGAFTMGFNSAIATTLNVFPQFGVKILEAIKSSDVHTAQKAQETLTEICAIITRHGSWVPSMKAAMNLFTPVNVGAAREPLANLNPEQIKEMKQSLEKLLQI